MDLGFDIGFERPWYLLLLLMLPLMWVLSFNSLAGLGNWRRMFALLIRTAVFTLLVMALANTQWRESTDRLTVIYVLDQSDSIPQAKRDLMLDYVEKAVNTHRREHKRDKAGVIIFGANAKIEIAPFDGKMPWVDRIESGFDLETGATSLESALKLAKASFPEDTARRVVIISDGNENLGDSLSMAQAMAEDGVGIDVIPIELIAEAEVSVEKIVLPTDIRKGQEFLAKVVLNNDSVATEDNPDGIVRGKLRLVQKTAQNEQLIAEQDIELTPGKNIRTFSHVIEQSSVFTFDAAFVPEDDTQDLIQQNNTASAFTHVRGKGRVLLIEDAFYEGEFLHLIETLQANAIEVDVMGTDQLFTSAAELLQYDSVILANVARASGDDDSTEIHSFSDAQIRMLTRNCEEMGCGLVMLGGNRSFGAGGWSNSDLEKAMPVDFQIKNSKISAVGALALMMHACEMANGNHWETMIARKSIEILGPMDYCGVVEWSNFGGTPRWLWKFKDGETPEVLGIDRISGNRKKMMGMVGRMASGDMPDFNGPMKLALNGLSQVKASMKHMIIISDGDPTPPTKKLLKGYIDNKIKISTVAIGTHGAAGNKTLLDIATATGGKYYIVKDPRTLPEIYQREARKVAKPVIKESRTGMQLRKTSESDAHEILQGIDIGDMPPFIGYVMTTVKSNPLVQQLALASDPNDDGENSTVLATWRYGVGRATAFTSDAGHIWTNDWLNNPMYEKLFVQMIRHSMRPIKESANFTVATELKDNKARIVVTALDDQDEFLNFLDVKGRGMGPNIDGFDVNFNQVGPGRYVAEYDVQGSGNYLFSLFPGEDYERLTTGINIPYSTEYSDRDSNIALLDSLSQMKPTGGEIGATIDGKFTPTGVNDLLGINTFRPTLSHAIGITDAWPFLLVICATAFFADVFIRRVSIDLFGWVGRGYAYAKSFFVKTESEQRQSNISRLQSRKKEIEKSIETRRAATRFEPEVDEKMTGRQKLDQVIGSEMEKTPKAAPKIQRDKSLDVEGDTSYTSRLLDAKRKAQNKQGGNKRPDQDS